MKKKLILIMLLVLSLGLYGCGKTTDADKFKEEYESVNGEKSGSNKIRTLDISKDNPFVYKEAKDIVKAIENNETFVVYFGFSTCPWCRSVLPYLIESAKDNKIDEIYYVDIKEIRDTLEYDNETGEFKTTKEGDKDYMKLIELLGNALEDYKLKDEDGEDVLTGEKRIYAPNVVVVDHGKPLGMTTGISEMLTDPYMEINKETAKDIQSKFDWLFGLLKGDTCTQGEGC